MRARSRFVVPALSLAVSLAGLTACDFLGLVCDYETDETCEDPTRSQISGKVSIPEANGASARTLAPDIQAARKLIADAARELKASTPKSYDVAGRHRVPGTGKGFVVEPGKVKETKFRASEVIVRAHEPIRGRKAEISRALSLALNDRVVVDVRLCGTEFRCLADLRTPDGKELDLAQTQEVVLALAQSPLLKYAERNLILDKMTVFPDDEFYSFQWHYAAIDVPAAWDITQGDSAIVGAVIDTGILFDHPDLAERVIGGADLIDDADVANDGDGRDDDGDDAGDNSCGGGCHSHHGSHVAGTMGAATNNGTMVSGITWQGGLLAVRVLGAGGGSLADIADGIEWAVGNDVDGVAGNPNPADVLNMSLGGQGESAVMDEAVADAVAAGAIVLVAAGNDNQDAESFTPANAPGAITVASVGNGAGGRPEKASYSNFGAIVDVAGPGGEQAADNDDDGNGDGVLSTIGDFVAFYQGTSMATPHVAGVAMLMKSVNPELDQEGARDILTSTADADIDCDAGCGAGQINAYGAVLAASGDLGGLSGASVRVGQGATSAVVTFRNFGDAAVDVDFSVGGQDRDSVSLDVDSGTIPAGGKLAVTATLTRNDTLDDRGSATVTAVGGGDTAEARVDWTADASPVVENVIVGAVRVLDDGNLEVASERLITTNALKDFNYKIFNIDPGNYLVIGLLDANNDEDFDDAEDATGFYVATGDEGTACAGAGCGRITVAAGETFAGADFLVAPGFDGGDDVGGGGDGALGDACESSSDCGDGLYCETFAGGYCTTDCNGGADECPAGSTCFDIGTDEPYQMCFKDCSVDSDCGRAGYVCDIFEGVGSCIPE